jgi:DNA-binding transcriptional MerR regulator
MLDVHPNTVRQWAKEFAPWLSAGANPSRGVHRAYTSDDIAVIRHIADMSRVQNMPWPAIAAALAQMPAEDLRAPIVEAPQNAPEATERTESALSVSHSLDALPAAIVEHLSPLLSAEFERGRELGIAQGRTEARRRVPPEYVLIVALVCLVALTIASMAFMGR